MAAILQSDRLNFFQPLPERRAGQARIIRSNVTDYLEREEAKWSLEWDRFATAWREMRGVPPPYTDEAEEAGCVCEPRDDSPLCALHNKADYDFIIEFIAEVT